MKNPNCRYPDMRTSGMCANPCPLCSAPKHEQHSSGGAWERVVTWLINLVVRRR